MAVILVPRPFAAGSARYLSPKVRGGAFALKFHIWGWGVWGVRLMVDWLNVWCWFQGTGFRL